MPLPDPITCTHSVIESIECQNEGLCEGEAKLSTWSASGTKRLFDVALVLLFSPFLLVALVAIGLAVSISSPGPAIFRQTRIGSFGKPFTIFKFRTMLYTAFERPSGVASASPDQITNVGRFLRRLKIDELPQCINVLRGDMSLVGPRPKIPEQQIGICNCRPGITGAATLAFAGEETLLSSLPPQSVPRFYRESILPMKQRLDSKYMARATALSDLRLLLLTVFRRWEKWTLDSYSARPALELRTAIVTESQELSAYDD
jgi:lipopolysaccharide/colanic/teichoic acid biosynthesis glycosyltransferase